jgi:hypothetical protein
MTEKEEAREVWRMIFGFIGLWILQLVWGVFSLAVVLILLREAYRFITS